MGDAPAHEHARPDHEAPGYPPTQFGPADEPRPAAPERPQSRLKRALGPIVAAVAAFFAKIKAILLLATKVKFLATAGTMLASIAAYALLWDWQFAVGLVLLLLVHELGHVIALRREGIKTTGLTFIPFMGAFTASRSLGTDALAEARVALAGPILGSIGALVCVPLWHATGNDLFRALAYMGLLLNLFNLLPVLPLDGGRAMAAMSPWMWFAGLAALVPLLIAFFNPILLIIAVFAVSQTWTRWQQLRRGGEREQSYYDVRAVDRLLVGAVYVALIALLAAGMHATYFARTLN